MAAFVDGRVVGGLTAHALPLTREEGAELFIYDVAVDPAVQRRGVGRALVDALRRDAATLSITVAFVPADDDDRHALDFYRALGGVPAAVTIFTFGGALRT
jgi:aminoglycoside 3-N-acetyltransferase I